MSGLWHRSRETERRRRRWQVLGLLLLALAVALYWADRKMTGKAGGRLDDWMPAHLPGREGRAAAAGTAPAGAEPMTGATAGADALGLRAEPATIDATEPSAETVTAAPPTAAAETGAAPASAAWADALEGEAPEGEPVAAGDTTATAAEGAPIRDNEGLTPAMAAGWVEGNGTNVCPEGFPIKGNASSRIYHLPGQSSYDVTIPEICFATEDAATAAGYRARKR